MSVVFFTYVLNNITQSFLIHNTHKTVHYIYIYLLQSFLIQHTLYIYIYIYIFITQSFLTHHKVQSLVNLPNRFRPAVDSKPTLNQSLQSATERSCFWLGIELQHAHCELKKNNITFVSSISTHLTIAKCHMNAAVSNRYRVYNTHTP